MTTVQERIISKIILRYILVLYRANEGVVGLRYILGWSY
jgi:hypothetical protein